MLNSQMFLEAESLDKVMESIWGGGTQLPFPENNNKENIYDFQKDFKVLKWFENCDEPYEISIFVV